MKYVLGNGGKFQRYIDDFGTQTVGVGIKIYSFFRNN